MKKWLRRILKWIGILLLAAIAGVIAFRFLYARDYLDSPNDMDKFDQVHLSWEDAMADGVLPHEEIAIHYAPVID